MTIHSVFLMNSFSGIGEIIYTDEETKKKFDAMLIMGMISVFQSYIQEAFHQKRDYIEFILGNWRVIIFPAHSSLGENIQYVVFQDQYDSIDYISQKIKAITEIIRPYLQTRGIEIRLPKDILNQVYKIASFTQKFPSGVVNEKDKVIEDKISSLENKRITILDLVIADVDEGIVFDFIPGPDPYKKTPAQIFYNLMSSVKFEKDLLLETKISEATKKLIKRDEIEMEGWVITPIGRFTDFFMVGYFAFPQNSESILRDEMSEMSKEIFHRIQPYLHPWPWKE